MDHLTFFFLSLVSATFNVIEEKEEVGRQKMKGNKRERREGCSEEDALRKLFLALPSGWLSLLQNSHNGENSVSAWELICQISSGQNWKQRWKRLNQAI